VAPEVKTHRVLIVEDEGLIAHDIAARLELLGYKVVDTVSTAAEAVEMAPKADVVLMDIRIDGPKDGIEAAREIREKHHVPVVFLTAHADRSTLDRAKITGPLGYLVKPLATASLQTAIEIAVYRHRMERSLEEQEAWLRTTLASVADATVVTGPDGNLRTLNRTAENTLEWTTDEARGLHYSKVIQFQTPLGDRAEPVELALVRDEPVDLDPGWKLLKRDGQELTVEGSAAPVRDAHEVFGAVLTFRDITARRWQEEQARQAQRMDTAARLAANVSEEYSNLVAIIRTHSEHLLAQMGEYSPVRKALEEIRTAAAAAGQITRRLASFGSRPVAQQETFSMNSLLRRMTKLIQSAVGVRVRVSQQIDPASGRIHADLGQIEQAVMSLVIHASRSMPVGGELMLETKQARLPFNQDGQRFVMLAVSYSTEEADIDHIFEPVASEERSLALPLAHSITREHGGYLTARTIPGRGTRLEMLLPHEGDQALFELAGQALSPTILLVDGSEAVRAQIHKYFEAAGYNLLEAVDADEAVALGQMHEGTLDLLIAEDPNPILVALRETHPRMIGLEMEKPVSQQTLLEKVGGLLGRRASI
jgi:PAS domain S-box-containing protein